MSNHNLPQELIDTVIDHLGTAATSQSGFQSDAPARRTLFACSLVSHAFLHRCRSLIFQEITLGLEGEVDDHEDRSIQQFLTLLETGSRIGYHVRSVRLIRGPLTTSPIDAAVLRILENLPMIEKFSMIRSMGCILWTFLDDKFKSAIYELCRRPTITSLHFNGFVGLPIPLITDCPNLANLEMHRMISFDHVPTTSLTLDFKHPPSVQSLRISECKIFLRRVFSHPAVPFKLFSCLKSFTVSLVGGDLEVGEVAKVIQVASNSLTEINIHEKSPRELYTTTWPQMLPVPRLPHLSSLSLHTRRLLKDQEPCFIDIRNFLRFGFPSLRCLALDFVWCFPQAISNTWYFAGVFGWDDLDDILSNEKKYPSLRYLEVAIFPVYVDVALQDETAVMQRNLGQELVETVLLPKLKHSGKITTRFRVDLDI